MNKSKLKRISKIDKKIIYRKLKSKFTQVIIDKFNRFRDYNISTFSYDYIAYYKLKIQDINILELLNINVNVEELVQYADKLLTHQYKILSDKEIVINNTKTFTELQSKFPKKLIPLTTTCFNKIDDQYKLINWQKDFNYDFEWQFLWFKDISYDNNTNADIKVPWELGRLQYLPWLAVAYSNTNEQKYKSELRNQIFDLIASNPTNFGVQWMTSMDIGIRLVNLLITFSCFQSLEELFDKEELELVESYLFDHYLHIKNNIEFSEGMRGNHYLSNLCSILIYLCFIDEDETKHSLIERYVSLIETELDYQFNSDGSNFEGSTRYHIFVNQMLISADIILQKTHSLSLTKEKMNKISSFTSELLQFNPPPQIGDNDSGFYWKVLNDEEITYNSIRNTINKNYGIKTGGKFINFGYIHNKYNNIDVIFKCGKIGQNGKGGHNHNDNLSYELYVDGEPFVVDIGTFCYTSNYKKRNQYRATKAHNVLTVADKEQNEYGNSTNDDMFWLDTDKSSPELLEWSNEKTIGLINYCGKPYKRKIEYKDKIIIISDRYESELEKKVYIYLYPSIGVKNVDNYVYKLWKNEKSIILEISDSNIEIQDYYFSPEYGVEIISKVLIISSNKTEIKHKYKVSVES